MKKTIIIGIIVVLSLLLVLSGCGGKDSDKKEVETDTSETVVVEGKDTKTDDESEEPDLPEEGVKDEGSDVTDETEDTTDDTEDDTEDDTSTDETEDDTEDDTEEEITDADDTQTAQNYRVVSMKDLKAYPEEMTIKVGTTVEWRNVNDNLQHIIGWRGQKGMGVTPEPILAGESWSYTFNEVGKITWFSTARPTLQGTITIEER
ncbi:hypothetical protein ACFL3V_03510 [Nanoarchaeota archaeon]